MSLSPLKGKHLQSFKESTAAYNIWKGSVSSGKTVASAVFRWVDYCINGPPGPLLMVGKTELTLQRNVIDLLIQAYGKNVYTRGHTCFIFGRPCYIVGASDERAEQKIRGLSLAGAYCDEISLYPESFVQMLKNRLRLKGAMLFGTMNPDNPNHFINIDLINNPEITEKTVWLSTMDDNPYLDPDYVQRMKTAYPKTSMWYKRYILGLDCLAEGAVYDMWDDSKHVYKNILPFPIEKYYVSIDYGTANPTVFLMFGTNGNRALCMKEYYYDSVKSSRQKTDSEYAQDFRQFVGDTKITSVIIDPSAASFRQQLRKDGWFVKDANNDVLDGIRTVSSMIQTGRYQVHESCKNHIMEFTGYVWDAKAQEHGEDRPMKVNDHSMDACRYFCHTVMAKGGYFIPSRGLY
jgi:PBSX family phage terminase large subunit